MAKSQPALLGTQVSGLVLARARGRPGPGLAQSQPALLGTQESWPKVNRPCWALKGLGPTGPRVLAQLAQSQQGLGPKSTGPVGHSRVLAQLAQGSWPNWPKVNRVLAQSQPALLGTQGSWPPSRPALLGTQGSWPNWPKVKRPCWALSLSWPGPPKLNQHCWGTQRLMGKNLEFFHAMVGFQVRRLVRGWGGEWTEN